MTVRFNNSITTGSGGPNPSDTYTIGIKLVETNAALTDVFTGALQFSKADTVAAQSEAIKMEFPAPDFIDTNTAPSEVRTAIATWRVGATTAASVGTDAWTTPTNAQGLNGVAGNATSADASALAVWSSELRLDPYPDPDSSLSTWTIDSVKLYEYASYTAGLLPAVGSWQLKYRLGTSAYVTAESIEVAFDRLATPKIFDITGAKPPSGGTWTFTDLGNLNTDIIYTSGLTETSSAAVDAVVIEVQFSKTTF